MSCPCIIPDPKFPETSVWGPLLWCILHSLGERAGSPANLFLDDERRAWLHFFKETGEIIPCPTCKAHYAEYLKEHPVDILKTLPHAERKDWIRTWYLDFHNSVNIRLNKPVFLLENLAPTYARVNIRTTLQQLNAPMLIAIKLTGTNLMKYTEWKRRLTLLLSIFGI